VRFKAGVWLLTVTALLSGCGAPDRQGAGDAPPTPAPTSPVSVFIHISPAPIGSVIVAAAPRPTATATAMPIAQPPLTPPTAMPAPTPAPGDDVSPREALLLAEINRVRAENGLPPYLHSPELSAAAREHSCDLAAHGVISHESSDGRTLAGRLAGADPPWEWPSESIAVGTDDPLAVVVMWMDEPPEGWHRRNILDAEQREVGAGYCYAAGDPSGNLHYWTADFARRGG